MTKTTTNTPTARAGQNSASLEPYAIAQLGENGAAWALDQLAKFRPGGANHRRLKAMADAGNALESSPALYAAAPELLEALKTLTMAVEWITSQADEGRLGAIERLHMGYDNGLKEARLALAKATQP